MLVCDYVLQRNHYKKLTLHNNVSYVFYDLTEENSVLIYLVRCNVS